MLTAPRREPFSLLLIPLLGQDKLKGYNSLSTLFYSLVDSLSFPLSLTSRLIVLFYYNVDPAAGYLEFIHIHYY